MSRPATPFRLWWAALTTLCLVLIICAPAPLAAGAWPREKGHGFISSTSRVSASRADGPYSVYSTTYLEYGLGQDLTLGLDIGHGVSGASKAVLFLRRPLGELAPGHIVAAELGIGRIAGEAALRPGLSYGHGFSLRSGQSGWISIESVAEVRLTSRRTDYKADFTLGLDHGDRFKSIFQLQTGVSHGDPPFARFAPSLVMRLGKSSHIELGLSADLTGGDQFGVLAGFWRDF